MSEHTMLHDAMAGHGRLIFADWLEEQSRDAEAVLWRRDPVELEPFKADYDWRCAIQEAIGDGYRWFDDGEPHLIDDVTFVFACEAGANDEEDWLAVVQRGDEVLVFYAGCDYTGWD